MLANFVLRILELNCSQSRRHKKTNMKICFQVLSSSTQRQNWSFHAVERTRTTANVKRWKMHVQSVHKCPLFFIRLLNMQICEVLVAFCRRACLMGSLRFDDGNVTSNQWFDWLNEEKQLCCTCGTLCGTIFWRSLPNDDVKFWCWRYDHNASSQQ